MCLVSTKIRAQGKSQGQMASASMCFLNINNKKHNLPTDSLIWCLDVYI